MSEDAVMLKRRLRGQGLRGNGTVTCGDQTQAGAQARGAWPRLRHLFLAADAKAVHDRESLGAGVRRDLLARVDDFVAVPAKATSSAFCT